MDEQIEDVFPKVRDAIRVCCDREPHEIVLTSRLVDDLGMESLDFVELVYELEQAFDITIPMGTMDLELEDAMGGEPSEVDGILTPQALARLREMVPGLHDDGANEVSVDDVPLMITVRSICGLLVLGEEKRRAEGDGVA